jgi:hypothetical protein
MTGAGTVNCSITLKAAAASGGVEVNLSSNKSAVIVPASLTVPANATSANFAATVSAVSIAQTVTLSASAGSVTQNFVLQLNEPVPTLNVNKTSLAFGDVPVNSAATQSVTVASIGSVAITVSAATLTGTGFTISGITFPVTLAPGQTATLNLQFDPSVPGTATGQLTMTCDSVTNSTTVIALSGTGTATTNTGGATTYQVDLNWSAPDSSIDPVVGYNIYRSSGSGSAYDRLNSSDVTNTDYVDSTVQNGQTYDYIVKSVDPSGVESLPSAMVSLAVP